MGQPVAHFEISGRVVQMPDGPVLGQFKDPEGHAIGAVPSA